MDRRWADLVCAASTLMKFNQKLLSFLFWEAFLVSSPFLLPVKSKSNGAKKIATGFDFLAQKLVLKFQKVLLSTIALCGYSRHLLSVLLTRLKVAHLEMSWHFLWGSYCVGSLSSHPLVSLFCRQYVHTLRNIPLLLQLFFLVPCLDIFPSVRRTGILIAFRFK